MVKRKQPTKLRLVSGLRSNYFRLSMEQVGFFWSILLLLVLTYHNASAEVFMAQDEALKAAFPSSDNVTRHSFVLTNEQAIQVETQGKAKLDSRTFTFFEGRRDGELLGYAAIDSHIVRTHQEVFMVVLTPDGTLKKTMILAFFEPPEYLPSEKWLAQMEGIKNPDSVRVGSEIAGIVGSSLTTEAVTSGIRKVLALFNVLCPERAVGEVRCVS